MSTPLDDEQAAVCADDQVAVTVDELGRLAQLLTAGFGDGGSDTEHRR